MSRGQRIIYNELDGQIIMHYGESENTPPFEKIKLNYIDLPYGDTTLKNVALFHIENGEIVVDKYIEDIETEEERLLREKEELENQLLLQTNNNIEGGIL